MGCNLLQILVLLILSLVVLPNSELAIAGENLTGNLKYLITTLTSPEYNGRDVPGPGGEKTARFLTDWLTDGVTEGQVVSTQIVPLQQSSLFTANSLMSLNSSENMLLSKWGDKFYFFPRKTANINISAEAVFCGYGISIPEDNRNDYPETVRGKIAIVFAGSDLPPAKAGMRANAAFKAAAAERAGALALVVVYADSIWPPADLAQKIAEAQIPVIDLPESRAEFPVAYFSMPGANANDVKSLTKSNIRVSFNPPVATPSENIYVMQAGKKDEWIVVGAHFDHLGEGFPGADDNASGVAGLLSLTERYGLRANLTRGIIFVLFTAEEDGLLGSSWFADHPPVAKEKIVAMINLDMIGRDGFESMRDAANPNAEPEQGFAAAYFSGGSPALQDVIRAATSTSELSVKIKPVNTFRHFGDAAPFHTMQIPTMHIFSGFHSDYHAITDIPEKIDYAKLGRMIDFTDRLIVNLVEIPERPQFDPTIKVEGGGMGY